MKRVYPAVLLATAVSLLAAGWATIMIRKYPTESSTVTTGKMEGNVFTVDTTQANGTKWHDVWTRRKTASTTPMKC
jgi:hypothetical protein